MQMLTMGPGDQFVRPESHLTFNPPANPLLSCPPQRRERSSEAGCVQVRDARAARDGGRRDGEAARNRVQAGGAQGVWGVWGVGGVVTTVLFPKETSALHEAWLVEDWPTSRQFDDDN